MKRLATPRLLFVSSMAIFGTIGLFVRGISVSSGELALYRAVLATIVVGTYLLLTRQKLPMQGIRKTLPVLILSGIAMGFNWILLFEAYKYTTVSVATLSYYFAPVIVTVACPLLFQEKLRLRQWICFFMATLGIVLIVGLDGLQAGSSHMIGVLFGLGAACLYAAVILLNKSIQSVEGIHRTFFQFLAAIMVLAPYVLMTGGIHLNTLSGGGWTFLLIVGLVHTGLAYCMYFSSLKQLPGQKVAILSYIDPLVAVLVSVLILGEDMTMPQILGGVLILGFTLWNEIAPTESHK